MFSSQPENLGILCRGILVYSRQTDTHIKAHTQEACVFHIRMRLPLGLRPMSVIDR